VELGVYSLFTQLEDQLEEALLYNKTALNSSKLGYAQRSESACEEYVTKLKWWRMLACTTPRIVKSRCGGA
jgi:hypothetical protein